VDNRADDESAAQVRPTASLRARVAYVLKEAVGASRGRGDVAAGAFYCLLKSLLPI
jgi:hypothetical protein